MRSGEAARVEDEIGIERNAVLVAKDSSSRRKRSSRTTKSWDPAAQSVAVESPGVDVVRERRYALQALAFARIDSVS